MAARESLYPSLRRDAEKWRDRAAADGGGTDPEAEQMLALLDEIELLRRVATVCPRCEGQKYDAGSCSLCDNKGALCV